MSKAAKLPPSAKPVKDLEAHEEAYSHFQGLLKTGIHTRDLDLWVRASAGRQNLCAGLAIGMGWQFYCAGQFVGLPDITIASQPFFHR
jgi:hypothetical protein